MDRFTAVGIARYYGSYDDPPSVWRDPPTVRPRHGETLLREVDQYARRIAVFGWGALTS